MPVPVKMTAAIGWLVLLCGCGGPIPTVRATAEPAGQFVRVKSVMQAQAEQAHAQQVRRAHVDAVEAAQPPAGVQASATTRPASEPASEPASQPAPGEAPTADSQ
ncbi:MAG: hypothetical protein NT031_16290 [Planctomycetota bacterium]|nr:hypothetical protein [Planctomycetota bacterium]